MVNNYLLIAVSRKPKSHFLHMLQLKGQRESSTWKRRGLRFFWLYCFLLERNTSFLFITHFIFCYLGSFIYYCKRKHHRYVQELVTFREAFLRSSKAATSVFPEVQTWCLSSGQSLKLSARQLCPSRGLVQDCESLCFFLLHWRIMCSHRNLIK